MKRTILFSKFLSLAAAAVLCCISCGGGARSSAPSSGSSGPSVSEAVDLGLSVNWAPYNVGATAPEETGDYFAWGEVETKDEYTAETYKWFEEDYQLTKYNTDASLGECDNKVVLDPEDDAVHEKWGSSWRMPAQNEIEELINSCTWEWTTQNGVNGYKVTGKNGKSIFFPAAGTRMETDTLDKGTFGFLWTKTLDSDYNCGSTFASAFRLDSSVCNIQALERQMGLPVRAVCEIKKKAGGKSKTMYDVSVVCSGGGSAVIVGESLSSVSVKKGARVTVKAKPFRGFSFAGWYIADKGNVPVSMNAEYTFAVKNDIVIEGRFMEKASTPIDSIPGNPEDYYDPAVYNVDGKPSYDYASYESDTTFIYVTPANPLSEIQKPVDLGLPSGVKWANSNVGAKTITDGGGYYAWGETEEKEMYNWDTYKWCEGSYVWTKYCTTNKTGRVDGKRTLDPEDDVAHVKWGGSWRMPTQDEIMELLISCKFDCVTLGGVNGYRVTGPNGNTIFLPFPGFCNDVHNNMTRTSSSRRQASQEPSGPQGKNLNGFYMSKSLSTERGLDECSYFYIVNASVDKSVLRQSEVGCYYGKMNTGGRVLGYSVRPVMSPENANSSAKSSAKYRVGDYYNDGSKKGIVFYVDATGEHGKIVSLAEECKPVAAGDCSKRFIGMTSANNGKDNFEKVKKQADWQNNYPAFAWCGSLGDGWYLPSIIELSLIHRNKEMINAGLQRAGGAVMANDIYLLSSSEFVGRNDYICHIKMSSGSVNRSVKSEDRFKFRIRAVSDF